MEVIVNYTQEKFTPRNSEEAKTKYMTINGIGINMMKGEWDCLEKRECKIETIKTVKEADMQKTEYKLQSCEIEKNIGIKEIEIYKKGILTAIIIIIVIIICYTIFKIFRK